MNTSKLTFQVLLASGTILILSYPSPVMDYNHFETVLTDFLSSYASLCKYIKNAPEKDLN